MGNRTAAEVPSGTTRYRFNERNWLETVVDPNGGVTRYGYDAIGTLIKTQLDQRTHLDRKLRFCLKGFFCKAFRRP